MVSWQRGCFIVWFTDAAIAAWQAQARTTPGRQPQYSRLAITTVPVTRLFGTVIQLHLIRCIAYLREFIKLLTEARNMKCQ